MRERTWTALSQNRRSGRSVWDCEDGTGHGCVMAGPVYCGVAITVRTPSAAASKCSLLDDDELAQRVDPVA